jgi:hypothetical protein
MYSTDKKHFLIIMTSDPYLSDLGQIPISLLGRSLFDLVFRFFRVSILLSNIITCKSWFVCVFMYVFFLERVSAEGEIRTPTLLEVSPEQLKFSRKTSFFVF